MADLLDKLLLVPLEWLRSRRSNNLACPHSLFLDRREASSEDSLSNEGDGHTEVEGVDSGPLAGSLLSSHIEDLFDNGVSIGIVESENISRDFDQERVEDTVLPLRGVSCRKAVSPS